MPELDPREQQERYEKQIHELQTQVRFLEDEIALLRRRLTNAPRQVKILEEKLLEARGDLGRAVAQNEKLAAALRTEKERIETFRDEVEKLSQPPASFGIGQHRAALHTARPPDRPSTCGSGAAGHCLRAGADLRERGVGLLLSRGVGVQGGGESMAPADRYACPHGHGADRGPVPVAREGASCVSDLSSW